jgi:HD-GYP domain-containing protein (c-di-GMP phosphodiesterase class II)
MGLRPDALRSLARGGVLHDIGKIGVPDQILNKPGILTPDERAEIEKHPDMGWEIVRQSPSLQGALKVVRYHHERMDGTGYPVHLAGDDIPLEARIAAVADVWDALTSDRAYRPAFPMDQALDLMMAARGSHFDPEPLDALLELLDQAGIRALGALGATDGRETTQEACHPTGSVAVFSSRAGASFRQRGTG